MLQFQCNIDNTLHLYVSLPDEFTSSIYSIASFDAPSPEKTLDSLSHLIVSFPHQLLVIFGIQPFDSGHVAYNQTD